jgi:branched-chain amino acid transport system substrate-binding protein
MMRKVVIFLIVAGFIFFGMGTFAWAKPIKVGAVINLTGPVSTWGQYHAKGHKDYFNYVNEVKGGIAGNKIEMILIDHAYKVPEGVAAVKRLVTRDKVDMIATWDAGTGISVKPIIKKYKTPTINYSVPWEALMPPIDYFYLPYGSYRLDVYAVLEYIRTIHTGREAPKVALLTYNNAYGRTIHKPSKEYAAEHGIKIVGIEEFSSRTIDLTTQLLRVREAGAEYIFTQILPATIITALKSADRIGWDPPFLSTWTVTDPDFFPMGEGLIRDRLTMQFCGCLPGDGNPGMKLLETLWDRYKTVNAFEQSYWEGVVIASIMERAFQRAYEKFGEINSELINEAMESFRDEDFGGLMPNVTYTKTNHEASFKGRIVKVHENNNYKALTNFFTPGKENLRLLKR